MVNNLLLKLLVCFLYGVLICLFLIIIVPLAYGEGCDSTTNSNCIETNSNANSNTNSNITSETTVKSPPPSAMAPSINSSNSDLCTVGVSGAVQTQILGISAGKTVRDMNCERLKNAKTLFDMGLRVAAVSVLCEDSRVHRSMLRAGSPCPVNNGLTGIAAQKYWEDNPHLAPGYVSGKKEPWSADDKNTAKGAVGVGGLLLGLLLLL
jgi:hypothetical protein